MHPDSPPLDGYRLLRLIRQGPRYRVSLAQAPDGRPVALKQLRAEQASASARFRLQREHDMLQSIASRFVVRPIALLADALEPTLVLPWHGGMRLSELHERPERTPAGLALADYLEIAHQAAQALQDIHHAGVLHLDLKPGNLVWNPAERQLTLVDFSSAMLRQGEEAGAEARLTLEGTLPFMSPEQAGLMNRPVDNRSDLYSLGIMLYWLAAGALPFEADDALGWAHAHLTAVPEALAPRRPDLPAAVCAIVHRLIAKSPDERYQTAWGLAHDLARCRTPLQAGQAVADFELGARDVSDRLNPAPALHGRAAEQAALRAAWQRSAQGQSELLLIAGDAGLGKTALVQELRPAVLAGGGAFLYGKFDAMRHDLPYSALAAALGGWIDQRLADPGPVRARWTETIRSALDGGGAALHGLLPRLASLLGELPEPAPLDDRGTRRRLQRAVTALLGVICGAGRPLLWVVDDVQWADAASIALLQAVLAEGLPGHLLLLALHRPAQPGEAELPAVQGLRRGAAEAGMPVQALVLPPLDAAASVALVRDILRAPADREAALAQALHTRAAGNPFALASLLGHLRGGGVLQLDGQRLQWRWDAQALHDMPPSDDMIELLTQQQARLPERARRLMALGACFGREFELTQIARLERPPAEGGEAASGGRVLAHEALAAVQAALQPACAAQFLVQRILEADSGADALRVHYRFVHDRVQEMAYRLLTEAEHRLAHGRIGRAMQAAGAPGDALLAMVNHLNLGVDPASAAAPGAREAREQLAALNADAIAQAMRRGAAAQAFSYAQAGLALAPADPAVRRDLTVKAYKLCGEMARWDDADRHYAALCADPPDMLTMARVHRNQMLRLIGMAEPAIVMRIGLDLLAKLGVEIDLDDSEQRRRQAYASHREAWDRGAYERLLAAGAPPTDLRYMAAVHALCVLADACPDQPAVAQVLVLEAMRLTLAHGAACTYWLQYTGIATTHIRLGGDYRAAMAEWPFWLAAVERHGDGDPHLSQLWRAHAWFVLPWNGPLAAALQASRRAIFFADRWGHPVVIATCLVQSFVFRLESGEPLAGPLEEAERAVAAAQRSRLGLYIHLAQVVRQAVRVLQGQTRARW
ncbi:MAG TPA: AAA family ATPase, partial [Ideonella sp.]|nr:AAA family ATPase [Ideonella sp.]